MQTASDVNSKVLDDYCWIHSTFHVRTEYQVETCRRSNFSILDITKLQCKYYQGNVGCIVDPELMYDKSYYTGSSLYHDTNGAMSTNIPLQFANNSTPDTSFYQWIPFILLFQVFLNKQTFISKDSLLGRTILFATKGVEDMRGRADGIIW